MNNNINCIKQYINDVLFNFNNDAAMQVMQEVSNHHRIQASQGYRNSANKVLNLAKQFGLNASLKTYAANSQTHFFTKKMFKEWNCKDAWLDIEGLGRVCNYTQQEMSIIQRSGNFNKTKARIVYIQNGIEQCDHNVNGALIYVKNGYDKCIDMAIEKGALGIITVSMPEIYPVRTNMANDEQMKNSHANLSFYHYSQKTENKLCGFALTPLIGEKLEQLCINAQNNNTDVFATFEVDSSLQDGTIENVEIEIEGKTDEEVLITAHLCHPRSSVNDNVTGVAAGIEAMNILNKLIKLNVIDKPQRTIKLLLIPEFTGTYAYLHENENRLHKIKAGINLDMLAGKQDGNAGALIIVDTPDCAMSFMGDLAYYIMEQLTNKCEFGRKGLFVPVFMGTKVPFVFGSDHYILSDPSIDIPCVALTQWPDKTYHTSVDNLEHIDINMLANATTLAAVYAYVSAIFNADIFKILLPRISQRFISRLNDVRFENTNFQIAKMRYIKKLYSNTLSKGMQLLQKGDEDKILPLIQNETELFYNNFDSCDCEENNDDLIFERAFKAPLCFKSLLENTSNDNLLKWQTVHSNMPDYNGIDDLIIYEFNGKNSISNICNNILCQTGIDCTDYINNFANLLLQLNLLRIKTT